MRRLIPAYIAALILTCMLTLNGCSFLGQRAGSDDPSNRSSADALLAQAEFDQLNGKWPHEVVDGYMKSLTGFTEVSAFVFAASDFDPETSAQAYQILKSHRITEFNVHEESAKVTVLYELVASVDRSEKVTLADETKSVHFKLVNDDGVWKITEGLKGRYVMQGRPGGDLIQRIVFYYDRRGLLSKTEVLQIKDPVATGEAYYSTLRILFYEGQAIPKGLRSEVPLNSTLLGVKRQGNVLLIDLLEDFDERLPDDVKLRKALAQIVRTGMQFEDVTGLKFLVKGKPYSRLRELGIDPGSALTIDSLSEPKPPIKASTDL